MLNRHFRTAINAACRAVLALGLATALVLPTLGPPAPARADHEQTHDPDARLQFVVKKVKVHDDQEGWGGGKADIVISGWVGELKEGCPADSSDELCFTKIAGGRSGEFKAAQGETKEVNSILIPDDYCVSSLNAGVPVHAGKA